MSTQDEVKSSSIVYARIQAARMSESDRLVALNAMRNADLIIDSIVWIVKKIERAAEHLFLRPSLKH